jgi:hypothetical protein
MLVALVLAVFVRAAPASAAGPGGVSGDDHVRSVHKNGNGTVSVSIWDAAPGVSAAALFADLRKHGVADLIDPATEANKVQAAEVDCPIQNAYALERLCGIQRIHWSGTHPVVYYIDHTGPQWPVYSAVSVWNQSTAMDVGYRSSGSGCPSSSSHCVQVYNADYGATKWTGRTTYQYNPTSRLFLDLSVMVQFNDYYSYNSAGLQQTACHELGHGLGLGHNLGTNSCLYFQLTNTQSTRYPATGDYLMLESIY